MVDDAQLLLGEQFDQFALGLNEASDVGILRTEIGNDLILLGARWDRNWNLSKLVKLQPEAHIHNAPRSYLELLEIFFCPE